MGHNEELQRARAELARLGADWALLASVENVTYANGWEVPTPYGPMAHLAYAPSLALLAVNDAASLLLVHGYFAEGARAQTVFDDVVSYNLVQLFPPYSRQDPRANFLAAVRDMLRRAGLAGQGRVRVAVEEGWVPAAVSAALAAACPGAELIDAGPALQRARMIKTEREIERLRFTAQVISAGQAELARQSAHAGRSDWDMWGAICVAMQEAAGRALYVSGELVTGLRCREVAPGGPVGYVTHPGDLARLDVSPRINGYWGDLTNTLVIGAEPSAKQQLYKTAAKDGFYAAAEQLRPGRRACDAFEAARLAFAAHGLEPGHYLGHQIGVAVNEGPWLVPGDATPIEAGMVFSIESGSYEGTAGDTGVRVEKSVIVRDSGPEIFPDFDWVF